ncbi:MAG: NYN domain-containing protein [Nanoarchaeota archaeon]|nr:NYN domain-containing protein [Nanoarchaeota archaeon]MBU1030724.1 NYN domain-containing protein [Nanoarchaeota archaeon]MBU1849191.1 NYN domain-containing protein [Nanoarchaeota archaeon]
MTTKHDNQRVAVFVDVQNMYYSAMNLYKTKVNFESILRTAVSNRKIIRAFAYVIEADVKGEKNFHDRLTKIGFEVKSKELQIFYGGAKKGDWDVGIAMDVLRMAPKVDTIVLVSGDGDFADLLKYVKSLGCRAEVISFGKTTSSRLLPETDDFIDMSKDTKKFLIKQ